MPEHVYYVDGADVGAIADAIRYKKGADGPIKWTDIPEAILNIPTGGGGGGDVIIAETNTFPRPINTIIATATGDPPTRLEPDGETNVNITWGVAPASDTPEKTYTTTTTPEGEEVIDTQWWGGERSDCISEAYHGRLGCVFNGLIPNPYRRPGVYDPSPAPYPDFLLGVHIDGPATFRLYRTDYTNSKLILDVADGFVLRRLDNAGNPTDLFYTGKDNQLRSSYRYEMAEDMPLRFWYYNLRRF